MNKNFEITKKSFQKNNYTYFENEIMKKHTTFGIGGEVKLLIYPKSIDELVKIIKNVVIININEPSKVLLLIK